MNTVIYALCEPGTRTVRYVGKTTNLKARVVQHIRSKADTHLGRWVRSLNGPPSVVELRSVTGDGCDAEKRFIRLARGCGLKITNATDGGEGLINPSLETRQKMRDRQLGSVHTEEHRYKCGSSNRGKRLTDSHKKAIGDANRGRTTHRKGKRLSAETRAKMSASRRGISFSEAHRASLSSARVAYLDKVKDIDWILALYLLP